MTATKWRQWMVDLLVGGVVGGVIGIVLAWNIAIVVGVPGGYEAGVGEVFAHGVFTGILWVSVLVGGPIAGVAVSRRQRHKRERRQDRTVGAGSKRV